MGSLSRAERSLLLIACLATPLATTACGATVPTTDEGETGSCPVGTVGCPCTAAEACDAGLQCFSEICVEYSTSTSTTTATNSATSESPTTTLPPPTSGSTSSTSTAQTDSTSTSTSTSEPITTTSGLESSTGELADWALYFDGTSYARKMDDGGAFYWTASDFSVEVWAEIHDTDATGVIFKGTNTEFTSGWVFYLHNEWHALVFSFFNGAHLNQVVLGPEVADIGTGWHHLAATKSGGSVFIYVDGTMMTTQAVPSDVAEDETLWSVGGDFVDNPDFNLRDVTLDDLRVSGFARYEDDFDPPEEYDDDTDSVILLLRLDEGDGEVASDIEASDADFSVESPMWVAGNPP